MAANDVLKESLCAAISPILDRSGDVIITQLSRAACNLYKTTAGRCIFFPLGACALVVQKEKNMHVCMCVHYSDAASAENYERVMNARQSRKLHLKGHLLCQRLIHSARLLHDRNLH